jgi:hypothetical protein
MSHDDIFLRAKEDAIEVKQLEKELMNDVIELVQKWSLRYKDDNKGMGKFAIAAASVLAVTGAGVLISSQRPEALTKLIFMQLCEFGFQDAVKVSKME